MKYFVSADIHGFFDEWMSALKKNDFDIDNQQHKIVVCGDLFDRGRQPKQIIDFVLAHKNKIILIKGNHEYLMEEMIDVLDGETGKLTGKVISKKEAHKKGIWHSSIHILIVNKDCTKTLLQKRCERKDL